MADFSRIKINSNAERVISTPLTRANFGSIISDFNDASITGLTKNLKLLTVSVPLQYYLESGDKLLKIVVSVGRQDVDFFDDFDDIMTTLLNKYKNDTGIKSALATAAGVQSSDILVEELANDVVYKAEFECSCAEDSSFQTVFTPKAVYYNNYRDDAAPTLVDEWCDTKTTLRQTS